MLTNFEELTFELTDYEINSLLPIILKGLETKHGVSKAVTNRKAVRALKERGFKINEPRFRKIIQYIRINGLISNLISTSKGYYIATDHSERRAYLESLRQRIQSMTATYDALEYQHNQVKDFYPY